LLIECYLWLLILAVRIYIEILILLLFKV